MKTFKNDAEFIEQLIQPVSAMALQLEAAEGGAIVVMGVEQFEEIKRTFEAIKSLAVARRDQVLNQAKEAV